MLARMYFVGRNLHKADKRAWCSVAMTSTSTYVKKSRRKIPKPFLADEFDAGKQNESHINKLYKMPSSVLDSLKLKEITSKSIRGQISVFAHLGIVIRQPAVELMNYLDQIDNQKPINKYVIYGTYGVGKTIMTIHILHYAYSKGFLLFHVPWPHQWYIYPTEVAVSPLDENMFDLPIEAGKWLQLFKSQNQELLKKLDLKTAKEYVWSPRDTTEAGTPLLQLIDFGIDRIKYACSVIQALTDEIKIASTKNCCKAIVIIDGFNTLFSNYTSLRDNKKIVVPAKNISLTSAFLNMTKYDWCNGAAVLTVDQAAVKEPTESYLPGHLLGTEGFEHLDPFIPIKLDNFTEEEFNTILDYYEDRRWTKPIDANGRMELKALTAQNPKKIQQYSAYIS